MRILFLSNFYPPQDIGGYGMLCLENVDELAKRGHQVKVLASTHGIEHEVVDGHIHRVLTLESALDYYKPASALGYPAAKRRNLEHLRSLVAEWRPDVIFVWGMWSLSKEVALEAEKLLPNRVVYYLANPWPIEPNMHVQYWDMAAERPARRIAKQAMRLFARWWLAAEWQKVPLQFQYAPACSAAQRDQLLNAGVPLKDAPVIYEGIDLAVYTAQADQREQGADKAVLQMTIVGTLGQHKGVHTSIEALALLPKALLSRVYLTILGKGHPDYEAYLRSLVEKNQLHNFVTFLKPIPRTELPVYLGKYDVLLLPSIWEEPLARIMQEGMAAGMVVIGAATGGTKEIIQHNVNGLLFPAADAPRLAAELERVIAAPTLRQQLATQGRADAERLFALARMVDDLEQYLKDIHAAALSH